MTTAPTTQASAPPEAGLDAQAVDRLQRRILRVIVASQILGGAGLAAGVTVGALLAERMLGSDGLAGVPTALFTLGSALTAFLVGRTHRSGRPIGRVSASPPAGSAGS